MPNQFCTNMVRSVLLGILVEMPLALSSPPLKKGGCATRRRRRALGQLGQAWGVRRRASETLAWRREGYGGLFDSCYPGQRRLHRLVTTGTDLRVQRHRAGRHRGRAPSGNRLASRRTVAREGSSNWASAPVTPSGVVFGVRPEGRATCLMT